MRILRRTPGAIVAILGMLASTVAEEAARPPRADIREAVTLGVHALTNAFDRDADGEPFFYANRRADGMGEFHHALEIGIPHVVGRAFLGCWLAETAVGVPFPAEARSTLARYCRISFENDDHINSFTRPDGTRGIELHNLREGLYALVAMIDAGGPDADWARAKAAAMLRSVESFTTPEGRLSREMAEKSGLAPRAGGVGVDATTSGRFIDALLDYHRLTKDPLAWKLAGLYARSAMETAFTPEGRFAPMKTSGGHIHSITSTLSGVARYADLADDRDLLERCARVLDAGVPRYFSSWGWGDEVTAEHPANVPSRGEVNQAGDVVRAALVLGRRVSPSYYGLAERFIRGSLLPDQLREDDLRGFLRELPDPKRDAERDVLRRCIGGYGFPLPNDRMRAGDWPLFTLDITSGAVHALCDAWAARVSRTDRDARVDLLFDYDSDDLTIRSGLPLEGRIEVRSSGALPVRLRIPEWVGREAIRVVAGGEPRPAAVEGGYLPLPRAAAGEPVVVTFPTPRIEFEEEVDGVRYRVARVGDQVVEIRPRGEVSPLP